MKYFNIPSTLFTENRKRMAALLPAGAMAILHSNDVLPTNADGTFYFKQNNDLFYLSGITQEETVLLLFPSHPEPEYREILFIIKPEELRRKWYGHQLSEEEATQLSGISNIHFVSEFKHILQQLMFDAVQLYLNNIEHKRAQVEINTRDMRFAHWCRQQYPLHTYARLAPLLMKLRCIKSAEEIKLMRKVSELTEKGFRRLLRFVKPGVWEKQVEAEMIHAYNFEGAEWADYSPIVASGANTCILHYNSNHRQCQAGDLLLVDAAASYGAYNADMTRTIPVNGRFSKRQKELYQAVLRVHKAMKKEIKPGCLMKDLQAACFEMQATELLGLGICTAADLKQKGLKHYMDQYCYHHFSHFLGLDVHDVGDFNKALEAGMVLTNEPGIYIPEEGIGVRIENNLLLTTQGVEDLMENIPIEAEEIERLMQEA